MARVVCRGIARKYHRFRPARFYGGIATADCVGCCLRCVFCWSWDQVLRPEVFGELTTPEEVADRLLRIARKKGFRQVRISGNEPTIGREHLIRVLELVPRELAFILETNGILIGYDRSFARDLARFENLYARVSLKGTDEVEFSRLTGAHPTGFELQLKALENLAREQVRAHPAVMVSFSSPQNVSALRRRLGRIHPEYEDIEIEELVFWGDVEDRVKKAGLWYCSGYQPDTIPPEQV
jgi:uncharacterized Fe-S cluster-containing radical SAM superfamily protein